MVKQTDRLVSCEVKSCFGKPRAMEILDKMTNGDVKWGVLIPVFFLGGGGAGAGVVSFKVLRY